MVRIAASSDVEQIYALDQHLTRKKLTRTLVHSAISRGECFVIERDGIIVGYAVMDYSFFGRGFIALIRVHRNYLRRGIASSLFDGLEHRCRSDRIFTSTNLSNVPMQGFLAAHNYLLSGIVQDLDKGDPELFYSKKLR